MWGRIPSIYGGLSVLCLVMGCALSNPGNDPPLGNLNFPIALATSPVGLGEAPRYLFVANANFDLRYNAGSVSAFDLEALADVLRNGPLPEDATEDPLVITPGSILRSQVKIGSYTSAMVISTEGDRLYLSVGADSNLTYIDVADGRLFCGGEGELPSCSDAYRTGDEATANPRRVEVPVAPTGVAVGQASDLGLAGGGDYVVMSHSGAAASLFIDRAAPTTGGGRPSAPLLVDVLTELNNGQISTRIDPNGIAWMPTTNARTDRLDNFITRVGVAADLDRPEQSYLYNAGTARLEGINSGEDTRDIAFATGEDGTRLAFILSRTPEALVIVDLGQSTPTRLFIRDLVPVGYGPSRMEVVRLPFGTMGTPRDFVFVTCFDSRDIFIVDPVSGRTFTISRTLSGPFELEVDPVRGYMYVTDFRASVIWVVTLEPLLACLRENPTATIADSTTCEPFRVASIGTPEAVRDLL